MVKTMRGVGSHELICFPLVSCVLFLNLFVRSPLSSIGKQNKIHVDWLLFLEGIRGKV